jgi:hypothetical protein
LMFGPRLMGWEKFSKPSLLQTRRHLSRNKHRMQLTSWFWLRFHVAFK